MSNDSNKKTDYEIIHEVLNGNKELYAEIIERYQNFVFSIVRKFVTNNEDVKDVVQEIFIKTYFCLPQYNIKYEFKNWLYKISLNYILDLIRNKNSKCQLISFENIEHYTDNSIETDLDFEVDEKIKKLEFAINRLKPKYKEVVILRYLEGLKIEEIAEVLNISCANVKVRLHRAVKKLQHFMSKL